MTEFRTERDSMGEVRLPAHAYYGPQTQRAVENFPISGRTLPPELIHALGLVKWAAAAVNRDLGRLSLPDDAVRAPGRLPRSGRRKARQPISRRRISDRLGHVEQHERQRGDRQSCDGIGRRWEGQVQFQERPTRLGRSRNSKLDRPLFPHPCERPRQPRPEHERRVSDRHPRGRRRGDPRAIDSRPGRCGEVLAAKAAEWKDILKIGRTHLADATPLSLGQEIGGLARQLQRSADRAAAAMEALLELPIGGTAVGTGINTHAEFGRRVCELLAKETGIPFVEAADHFEANAQRDGLVECHGQLRTIAATLFNVANNIRWLASGPRCGFHEITLPDLQPGSSIMPGKVNPVLCESLMQAAARVLGNDQTIVVCGAAGGQFQLNVMMPVMADAMLESVRLLANATGAFAASVWPAWKPTRKPARRRWKRAWQWPRA